MYIIRLCRKRKRLLFLVFVFCVLGILSASADLPGDHEKTVDYRRHHDRAEQGRHKAAFGKWTVDQGEDDGGRVQARDQYQGDDRQDPPGGHSVSVVFLLRIVHLAVPPKFP